MPPSPPTMLLTRKGHNFPGTPGFGAFSMEMQPSPAVSTTPLRSIEETPTPSRESFAKHDASADLRQIRIIYWTRIILSVLLIATGAAIVGCEVHALHSYNSTNLSNEWFLPLWPQNLDLRPSVGILVGGAVVVLTSCLNLCCAILPAGLPRFSFLNMLFIVISILGLVASAFATGFSAKIYSNTSPDSRDTIQSWACRWYDGATNNNSTIQSNSTISLGTNEPLSSPSGFGRLCLESHAAFDITVLTLILEVGAVGFSCAAYWLERKMR